MAGLCEGGNEPPGSLKARKTSEETKPDNQPMRESNPRPSATPYKQTDVLSPPALRPERYVALPRYNILPIQAFDVLHELNKTTDWDRR
ncbi:hypothetical protein ANN_10731 [Periplaneta americana]|uniref:Uncharacterized protein n=1 Tax=Periplaneta americana TaxID=6978 RepID=A0ABQ8T4A8_PERAM|nr:hypothetical protein ANN_10731 [Periplaneta americana]